MLVDVPLFVFTLELQEWQGRLWLCEICTYWNGIVEILEMVEVTGELEHAKEIIAQS